MAKRFIDAEALLEELQEELDFESPLYTKEQSEWFDKGLKCAVRNIKHQPTADVVEVRHAEWIWVEDGVDDYEQYWVCSVCKEKTYFETKFCSECGAKMDKGVTK